MTAGAGGGFLSPGLFQAGERVLAAVSGGADSLAMLHALAAGRASLGIELTAAHVHHGMRGAAADADVAFLAACCAAWDVPLLVAHRDVPALSAARGVSLELAGREARYEALRELAAQHGCAVVATAHTASDQAETVLLNLLRGCGLDGLAGIPTERPLYPGEHAPRLVRPLLHRWRAETEAYCAAHGLEPRHDVTNADDRYRRNRVRRHLLPQLERESPGFAHHLFRLAAQAREDSALLDALAAQLLNAAEAGAPPPPHLLRHPGSSVRLHGGTLASASPALARRALRTALRRTLGPAAPDSSLVERLLEMAAGSGPSAVDLPGGAWRARRRGAVLELIRTAPPSEAPEPVALPVGGVLHAPEFGVELSLMEIAVPAELRVPPNAALLALEALQPPLVLRGPHPGERLHPLGAPGRRLLSDVLSERRIPVERRPAWPVVADRQGVLWVVGAGIDERARVRPGTARCLHLEVRLLPEDPNPGGGML